MDWHKIKNKFIISCALFSLIIITSCSVSYSFTGTSTIDYNVVKTVSIAEFPIKSDYVYAPLATRFNEELKDKFIRQTRLTLVRQNGDLDIDGEITGYNQYNQAVTADGYSSETKLTITVNVRYVNNSNHEDDFDNQQFSAFRVYDSTKLLTDVQDQLIAEMVEEIVDQIYNATIINW